jgi:hypothetical protein
MLHPQLLSAPFTGRGRQRGLVFERPLAQDSLIHDVVSEWFDQARDCVLDTIEAASQGRAVDDLLPKSLLAYFDQFGRSLRDDEHIEFSRSAPQGALVIYDNRVRKTLVLKSSAVYRTEESVRGSLSELNLENRTFTLKPLNGEKLTGHFSEELRSAALGALEAYGEALVMVEGAVVRDQADNRKRIEQVTRIEPLDPLDVPARLESLGLLRDGWLDGKGTRLSASGLAWLSNTWEEVWPDDSPLPHVYPTPEGGLQLEWSVPLGSITAEVELDSHIAQAIASRTPDGEILEEIELNLDRPGQWKSLVELVGRHGETPTLA